MDNFTEIKEIWQSASTADLPKPADIVRTIKGYRYRQILKAIGVLLAAVAIGLLLVWTVMNYHSKLLTTRIGEACYVIALVIILYANAQYLRRIPKANSISNSDFIAYLKAEQRRQMHWFSRTQVIGFAISAIGLALYLFEAVHTNLAWAAIGYTLVGVYVIIMWFVLRPIAMKKKMKKLSATIAQLEELSTQLSNN